MNPTHIILLKEGFAVFEMPNEKDFSGDQWKENNAYKQAIANAIPFALEDQLKLRRINLIKNHAYSIENILTKIGIAPNGIEVEIKEVRIKGNPFFKLAYFNKVIFKKGDFISMSNFLGDSGTFISYEFDKIVWRSELGGIYKSSIKDYNFILKKRVMSNEDALFIKHLENKFEKYKEQLYDIYLKQEEK